MKIKEALRGLSLSPPEVEMVQLKEKVSKFLPILKKEIAKKSKKGNVFLGGSFAKDTLVKKKIYDIDIFVRLPKNEFNQTAIEKAVEISSKTAGYSVLKVHGSREYYRISVSDNATFEIVPSLKITNPKQAENVIDLSYFHVDYVKENIAKNKNLAREIQMAKKFCMAQEVYGAESYIRGFSGYAIECLIINYKTFLNFLKAVVKSKGKLIIDSAKHYKKKDEILYLMNESKTSGPIVLVDPTWKERNVCAAVSQEGFDALKSAAVKFLKHPNKSFFEEREFSVNKFKSAAKGNKEYVCVCIETDRQDGDIAGTKLKKYSNYFTRELGKPLSISTSCFSYNGGKIAQVHLIASPRRELVFNGPPVKMNKNALMFKAEHRNVFVKSGKLFARETVDSTAREVVENYISKNKSKARDMGIIEIKVEN
jgi:tRNA nucleotidyltransferase (CCA-adding enzyme)